MVVTVEDLAIIQKKVMGHQMDPMDQGDRLILVVIPMED